MSRLNTNTSVNGKFTAETSRVINSEISHGLSRKLEEVKIDLNTKILETIKSSVEEKALPTIQNAKKMHIVRILLRNWTFGETDRAK